MYMLEMRLHNFCQKFLTRLLFQDLPHNIQLQRLAEESQDIPAIRGNAHVLEYDLVDHDDANRDGAECDANVQCDADDDEVWSHQLVHSMDTA